MPGNSLLDKYKSDLARTNSSEDPAQLVVLKQLQQLSDNLAELNKNFGSGLLRRLAGKKRIEPKGIYLWGGVGRGKTYLMDFFFDAVPIESKKRIHFHRFMQSVHSDLKRMRNMQSPLSKIGKDFAKKYRLLCLDEFFVLDIGDAVILAGLLKSLIENDVIIVTTSNTPPNNLYLGGIQRDRFLPAIRLINAHMNVVNIKDGTDYRLQVLSGRTLYFDTLGEKTDSALVDAFNQLTGESAKQEGSLDILGRDIQTVCHADHLAWFNFQDLCDGPRSKADYIEIANLYRTVMLTEIPQLTWEYENQARRFIELVDEFYDRGVHLIISATTSIDNLYTGKRLVREYERTSSRLHEMQSEKYLARAHTGKLTQV